MTIAVYDVMYGVWANECWLWCDIVCKLDVIYEGENLDPTNEGKAIGWLHKTLSVYFMGISHLQWICLVIHHTVNY